MRRTHLAKKAYMGSEVVQSCGACFAVTEQVKIYAGWHCRDCGGFNRSV